MKIWRTLLLLSLVPLLAMMSSCSSDDPAAPETDSEAPTVTQVDPVLNETGVPVGVDVTITFSEDMDPDTADGNVTLSSGGVPVLSWGNAHTLTIGHDDWAEGTVITVTVGTALADEAGNTLAAVYTWTFTTEAIILPVVVQVDPPQSETDVFVGEDITVTFNKDMDPATATGNITLSHGTITSLDWDDARTLSVQHDNFPEGTEITVTVGTGLTDADGNAIAEAFGWSFWTQTSDVILMNTLPADGDEDVPLNTQIWLEFSQSMNSATLPGAITVSSPDKVIYPYTIDGEWDEWTLTLDADLPISTVITVTITTDAQGQYGDPLLAETSFSFTTDIVADTTPPQLLSIEPADGSIIPTDTSFLRLTFDEPISDDSLEPSMISGQLMFSMYSAESAGVWSNNYTVFTVALAPPLTPGSILAVEFESFADMSGNVQTTDIEWSVTVTGTPDLFPVLDNYIMYYQGTWGLELLDQPNMLQVATRYDIRTGGEFWRWQFESSYGPVKEEAIPFVEYDRFMLTSTAIQFLGFHEVYDDPADKAEIIDIDFTPPVEWLRLPVTTDNWSGTSTFSPAPEEGATQVEYTVTVDSGVYEVEAIFGVDKQDDDPPPTYWLGCRKVTVTYNLTDGVDNYENGTDVIWYCPGVGPVRKTSEETDELETEYSTLDLMWAGLESDFPTR